MSKPPGLTLRDWFAGRAMQAAISTVPDRQPECASDGVAGITTDNAEELARNIAEFSYQVADMMLKERAR